MCKNCVCSLLFDSIRWFVKNIDEIQPVSCKYTFLIFQVSLSTTVHSKLLLPAVFSLNLMSMPESGQRLNNFLRTAWCDRCTIVMPINTYTSRCPYGQLT